MPSNTNFCEYIGSIYTARHAISHLVLNGKTHPATHRPWYKDRLLQSKLFDTTLDDIALERDDSSLQGQTNDD